MFSNESNLTSTRDVSIQSCLANRQRDRETERERERERERCCTQKDRHTRTDFWQENLKISLYPAVQKTRS